MCSNGRISHQSGGGVVAVGVFERGAPEPSRERSLLYILLRTARRNTPIPEMHIHT